jgi:leucyl-tRNA synthetase
MRGAGYLGIDEPFTGLFTQGMVCHETYRSADGRWLTPGEIEWPQGGAQPVERATHRPIEVGRSEKMSKSRKNTVDPNEIIETYGADTARWFMLSDSPPERDMEWTAQGVEGAWRFVNRLWRMVDQAKPGLAPIGSAIPAELGAAADALRRTLHKTIDGVSQGLEQFRFNSAVARVHALANALSEFMPEALSDRAVAREAYDTLARLIGPMMPHLAEELWRALGHETLLVDEPWPVAEPALLVDDMVTMAVQVNGKLRATLDLPRDADRAAAEAAALSLPAVVKAVEGRSVRRVILVPNRIVNVVI